MIVISNAYESLGWALSQNWTQYQSYLLSCCKKTKTSAVHQLRITLRRFLAILDIAEELHFTKQLFKLRKCLKSELDTLRNLRDYQGQEKSLLNDAVNLGKIHDFLCELKRKRKHEEKRVKKYLNSEGIIKQGLIIQGLGEMLLEQSTNPILGKQAQHTFERLLVRHFKQLESRAHLADASDPISFHQIRIEFKKFRYTWDAMATLYPIPNDTLAKLKEFQKLLGGIQDSAVLLQLLYEYLVDCKKVHLDLEFFQFLRVTERKQDELISQFFSRRDEFLNEIRPGFLMTDLKVA